MPRNPKVEFDLLQMYFGEPYVIDLEDAVGSVTVYSPTIGDILSVGEKVFYETLNIFVCNTTQYRLPLWKMNVDWNEISDFQLFVNLYHNINPKISKLLFGDLDFEKFVPLMKRVPKKPEVKSEDESKKDDSVEPNAVENLDADTSDSDDENKEPEVVWEEQLILWDDDDQIEINYDVYNHFHQYIQTMFSTFPEEKITEDRVLKQWYINKDERAVRRAEKDAEKGDTHNASIQSLISACINHPGFKYKLQDLKQVGVFEFYDSVKRLQVYEQSTALMKGMYSGFVDGSKINAKDYNFMREV